MPNQGQQRPPATSTKPQLHISETILQTARLPELREWYRTVLGIEPSMELNAQGQAKLPDGSWRAAGMQVCFFELNEDYPYTQTIGLFGVPGTSRERTRESPGLHHMQLHTGTTEALVSRFEELAAQGIRPNRNMNHGPSISFYYGDPDGNIVELTCTSYATLPEYRAYLSSPEFQSNLSGVPIDAEDFCRRFRSGEPIEELRKFPA